MLCVKIAINGVDVKSAAENANINSWLYAISSSDAKNSGLFKRVSELVALPKRKRIAVNVDKLDKQTKEGEVVIVPGKVLAAGKISHKISICAVNYSADAERKLKEAKCDLLSIEEILKRKPRIII